MAQPETLHPDLWLIRYLPGIPLHIPIVRKSLRSIGSLNAARKASSTLGGEDLVIQSKPDAQGKTHPINLFISRPTQNDGPLPVILWIHGGGMVIGSHKENHKFMNHCSTELGALVVSPDYRLAPDHPAPAAQEDCFAAWQWIIENAQKWNLDLDRLVVGGVSAGGGLAAAIAQRVYDHGGPQPKLQVLIYPMLDDRTAAKPRPKTPHYVWTYDNNIFGWTSYLNASPAVQTCLDTLFLLDERTCQAWPRLG